MAAIQIGSLADVPEGGAQRFLVGGMPLAVFHVDAELYALDDTCSHAEASLSKGEIDTDELCVSCPLHGSLFDLRSGQPRTLPAFRPVATYKVWAEGDALFVEYPK
ncbi:MAG: non-heme iron oxygenase ferredoxin subunit [Oscillochloris sp.]|nr:non-heme iron oxygenase ferredoxin subunit [Oscillochloris sp.]